MDIKDLIQKHQLTLEEATELMFLLSSLKVGIIGRSMGSFGLFVVNKAEATPKVLATFESFVESIPWPDANKVKAAFKK